ncbi:hypothetical protein HOY82DRAFT_620522, partial [Tuber indicum]
MLRKNKYWSMRSRERCRIGVPRKLIFAGAEGFEAGLNGLHGGYSDDSDGGAGGGGITLGGDVDADAGADLQPLKYDELFFVDKGLSSTDVIPTRDILCAGCDSLEGEEAWEEECLPAWKGFDDGEMLTISLANWALLCKLPDTETADLISGKKYSVRLRRQFESVYPVLE